MRLFQTYKMMFDFMLVKSNPLRLLNVLPCVCFVVGFIDIIVYMIIEANTFQEYLESFYVVITLFTNICGVLTLFQEGLNIFELISHFENTIDKRKVVVKIWQIRRYFLSWK